MRNIKFKLLITIISQNQRFILSIAKDCEELNVISLIIREYVLQKDIKEQESLRLKLSDFLLTKLKNYQRTNTFEEHLFTDVYQSFLKFKNYNYLSYDAITAAQLDVIRTRIRLLYEVILKNFRFDAKLVDELQEVSSSFNSLCLTK
jgi:hypothetical protein